MAEKEKKPYDLKHASILVGRYGELQLFEGWHDREVDGRNGMPYRACQEEAVFRIKRAAGSKNLCLVVSAPVGLKKEPMVGRIVINGRKYELAVGSDTWVLRRYPIESSKDYLKVHLQAPSAVIPNYILGNGDARRLAWFLSAVWQE